MQGKEAGQRVRPRGISNALTQGSQRWLSQNSLPPKKAWEEGRAPCRHVRGRCWCPPAHLGRQGGGHSPSQPQVCCRAAVGQNRAQAGRAGPSPYQHPRENPLGHEIGQRKYSSPGGRPRPQAAADAAMPTFLEGCQENSCALGG